MLAAHVILTTYGFWLPNDPRGSWSDFVAAWELLRFGKATKVTTRQSVAHVPHNQQLRREAKQALKYPPVLLTGIQARAVARGFARATDEGNYSIHSCSILEDHVHLVIGLHDRKYEQIVRTSVPVRPLSFARKGSIRWRSANTTTGASPLSGQRDCGSLLLRPRPRLQCNRYVDRNPPTRRKTPPQSWSFVTPFPDDSNDPTKQRLLHPSIACAALHLISRPRSGARRGSFLTRYLFPLAGRASRLILTFIELATHPSRPAQRGRLIKLCAAHAIKEVEARLPRLQSRASPVSSATVPGVEWAHHLSVLQFVLLTLGVSLFAGLAGSLLGLGGGIIVVPALTLLFGINIRLAVGRVHRVGDRDLQRRRGCIRPRPRSELAGRNVLEIGTVTGASPARLVAGHVQVRWLFVIFGLMMGYSAIEMFRHRKQEEGGARPARPACRSLAPAQQLLRSRAE